MINPSTFKPSIPDVDLKLHPQLEGIGPEIVKQILLRALQDYFSIPNKNNEFLWTANEEDTKLLITDELLSIEQANAKPILMVIFEGGSWSQLWNNNYVQDIYVKDEETNDVIKNPHTQIRAVSRLYTNLFQGNITIICRHRGTKVIKLANQVFMFLTIFADILRDLGLFDIETRGMSREMPVQGDVEIVQTECRVSLVFKFQQFWAILNKNWDDLKRKVKIAIKDTDVEIVPCEDPGGLFKLDC